LQVLSQPWLLILNAQAPDCQLASGTGGWAVT
jgi:hypothetical protein